VIPQFDQASRRLVLNLASGVYQDSCAVERQVARQYQCSCCCSCSEVLGSFLCCTSTRILGSSRSCGISAGGIGRRCWHCCIGFVVVVGGGSSVGSIGSRGCLVIMIAMRVVSMRMSMSVRMAVIVSTIRATSSRCQSLSCSTLGWLQLQAHRVRILLVSVVTHLDTIIPGGRHRYQHNATQHNATHNQTTYLKPSVSRYNANAARLLLRTCSEIYTASNVSTMTRSTPPPQTA
jgi:hypothetical protein